MRCVQGKNFKALFVNDGNVNSHVQSSKASIHVFGEHNFKYKIFWP